MSQLILLVGNIGSGKSTLTKEYAKKGYLIINDDSIVNALHAGDNTLYNDDLKPLYKAIDNQIIYFAKAKGLSVVIDRPNMSKMSRSKYIAIAKSLEMEVVAYEMPILSKEEHVANRMKSDARGHSAEKWGLAYDRHQAEYEPLDISEGFDEICSKDKIHAPNHKFGIDSNNPVNHKLHIEPPDDLDRWANNVLVHYLNKKKT